MVDLKKRMSDEGAMAFIKELGRTELWDNTKHRYLWYKAIRTTMIALGYDEQWVGGHFRDMLEDYWDGQLQQDGLDLCHRCSGHCELTANETQGDNIPVTRTRLLLGERELQKSKKLERKKKGV